MWMGLDIGFRTGPLKSQERPCLINFAHPPFISCLLYMTHITSEPSS